MKSLKRNIILSGFSNKEITNFRNIFKNLSFFNFEESKKKNIKYDVFISKNRQSFERFYNKSFNEISKNLKWIHLPFSGLEKYPNLLKQTNYCLTNSKIIQGPQVADHAFALLLSITRNLSLVTKYGENIKFQNRPIELHDKKILIVGFGGIGKCIAERARGFKMKISALNLTNRKKQKFIEKFYLFKDFKKAVKDKDIIFLSVPLTKKTKKLYNLTSAKFFKKGAIIINVSREGIICEKALYKNLKNRNLKAAGVDVYEDYSSSIKNKLKKLSNFIFTPHIAGISDNSEERNKKLLFNNIRNFIKKKN